MWILNEVPMNIYISQVFFYTFSPLALAFSSTSPSALFPFKQKWLCEIEFEGHAIHVTLSSAPILQLNDPAGHSWHRSLGCDRLYLIISVSEVTETVSL
jgi:hypothetical protein